MPTCTSLSETFSYRCKFLMLWEKLWKTVNSDHTFIGTWVWLADWAAARGTCSLVLMKKVQWKTVVKGSVQLTATGENEEAGTFIDLDKGQAGKGSVHCGNRTEGLLNSRHAPYPIHSTHWRGYGAMRQPEACSYPHPSGLLAFFPWTGLETCISGV